MRRIKLTNCNKYTTVDDCDYEKASSVTWAMTPDGYARRNVCVGKVDGKQKQKKLYLHRFLLDAPHGFDVDHKNHNRLDNRRSNLRILTRALNLLNRRAALSRKAKTYGVYKTKSGRWSANMSINDKTTRIGTFDTKRQAINARKQKEIERYDSGNMV